MTDATRPWLDAWNEQPLDDLAARFRSLGADEPESWASSELEENIPQTARLLFLRALWRGLGDRLDEGVAALERVRAEGGDTQEMRRALASCLYGAAFGFLYLLDEPDGTTYSNEPHFDVAEDEPRWALMELSPDGATTGRAVEGLHESLIETAPGGEEAASAVGWF